EWLEKLVKLIAMDKNGEDMQVLYLKSLTMKEDNGTVNFNPPMDLSLFDKKADTYDKGDSSRSIHSFLKNISGN
ncbi:hypothetical protein MKC70_16695, partial [[Clostridium] innocuum]|nr:hypothetical protein [[Clostridium] innocuum]MCR0535568.1 hypothetical protein [[Clostridium] innocuum]